MADPLRETRAMVLACIPFPPLPVVVHKLAEGGSEIEDEQVLHHRASTNGRWVAVNTLF